MAYMNWLPPPLFSGAQGNAEQGYDLDHPYAWICNICVTLKTLYFSLSAYPQCVFDPEIRLRRYAALTNHEKYRYFQALNLNPNKLPRPLLSYTSLSHVYK